MALSVDHHPHEAYRVWSSTHPKQYAQRLRLTTRYARLVHAQCNLHRLSIVSHLTFDFLCLEIVF